MKTLPPAVSNPQRAIAHPPEWTRAKRERDRHTNRCNLAGLFRSFSALRNRTLSLQALALGCALLSWEVSLHAASVTYTTQTGAFNALLTEKNNTPPYGGTYNNGGLEVAQYANGGSFGNTPGATAFETFNATGNGNSGTARPLQIGDQFTITAYGSGNPSAGGRYGISFNDSTTYSSAIGDYNNNSRAMFRLDDTGNWKAIGSATQTSGAGSGADRVLTIRITSSSTYNATIAGTTYYDQVMAGTPTDSARIQSLAIFTYGDNNPNTFWKSASCQDTGTLEFGTGNGSSTISGLLADGIAADSASTARANQAVKNGTGAITLANSGNTYSGGTTINAGTLSISSDGNLGAVPGSLNANSIVLNAATGQGLNTVLSITADTTLNANRGITIGANGAKLDAGAHTLTINGPVVNGSGNNHLYILATGNTTINGNLSGTGDIVKQGAGTLTLDGSVNTFGTATANFYLDKGTIQGACSGAFGQTSSGGGAITMGADQEANNGAATLLLSSAGASAANAINVRHYSSFNASKTIGGNAGSGTVTYSGTITLNDNASLTASSGGVVQFGGVIQEGTAAGGQDVVSPAPGITVVGGGTVQLSGSSTYSGGTTVSAGTLLANNTTGSGTGSGAVTVQSAATLGGNGTISGAVAVQSGAALAPGMSAIGTLTLGSSLTLSSGATAAMEINNTSGVTTSDKAAASGAVAYAGKLKLIYSGNTLAVGNTFDLFDGSSYSGAFTDLEMVAWPDTTKRVSLANLTVNGSISIAANSGPTATSFTLPAHKNSPARFPLAKYASDADGYALTVQFGGFNHGGGAAYAGGIVTYTPATDYVGTETFTYTVTDPFGASTSGTVTAPVTVSSASGANVLAISKSGNTVTITYAGIPRATYKLQYTTSDPINWQDVSGGTGQTDAGGRAILTDPGATDTSRLYRTRYVSGP